MKPSVTFLIVVSHTRSRGLLKGSVRTGKVKLVFCMVILPLRFIITHVERGTFLFPGWNGGWEMKREKIRSFLINQKTLWWMKVYMFLVAGWNKVPENMPLVWFRPSRGLPCPDLGIFFQASSLLCYIICNDGYSIALLQTGVRMRWHAVLSFIIVWVTVE